MPEMQSEFINTTDRRWRAVLQRVPHDFYQFPEYLRFTGEAEGGEPLAFWAEAEGSAFLLPLLRRKIPEALNAPADWHDLATPYGYPAPLLAGDAALWPRFLSRFAAWGREHSGVCAFVRLHPLLAQPVLPADPLFALQSHGQTIYMDLEPSAEDISRRIRENHRRDIKKLRKSGFEVRMDDWDDLGEFVNLYHQTMERLSADSFYFFSGDYFRELRRALPHNMHLCSIRSPEGELAAAALFVCTNGIIEYHLGGTAGKFLSQAPSKLMFDFVWRWGKEAGFRFFHLGGGLGASKDSLFRFKEGFSRQRGEFATLRIIFDMEKYRFLEKEWQQGSAQLDHADYFPAYRRPCRGDEVETGFSSSLTTAQEMISE